jgi:hypothetical protein
MQTNANLSSKSWAQTFEIFEVGLPDEVTKKREPAGSGERQLLGPGDRRARHNQPLAGPAILFVAQWCLTLNQPTLLN